MTTNVPAPTFGPQGFIAPAESAILAGRLADMNSAFGGNLNTTNLNSPQGQLASSEAASLGDANGLFLALANGVDPAYASGRLQDGIARIYFIERDPARSTVIGVVCRGAQGTVIPTGALLKASDGNTYTCTGGGTIDSTGVILLAFACQIVGPIACPAQTFVIVRTIPGWDSAISPAAGTPGVLVESRSAFEARRAASVAKNSIGSVPAIRGAVLAVPGVLDAYVVDNPTGQPKIINGYTLLPHSVYVAAVGGSAGDIAAAIWTKKSIGCDYNGNTVVRVSDLSGYAPPYPSYDVKFEIPAQTQVVFNVTLANVSGVPANALFLVQAAIQSAFVGGDNGPRARIGSTIYASRFYAPISLLGPWAQVVSIEIGVIGANLSQLTLPIDQAPVVSAASIQLSFA